MGMERDFSETVKEGLLEAVKDIEEEDSKYWIFSGLVDSIGDAFISDDIASYEGDIDAYHRAILDKKDTTAEKIEKIWEAVADTDESYQKTFDDHASDIEALSVKIQNLADVLNPAHPNSNGIPGILRTPEWLANFYTPITREEETTIDLEMQEEVQDLLNQERFSEETWRNASEDERRQMLQDLYDEVQRIMGTDAIEDLVFEELGENTNGSYNHGLRRIRLNSDKLGPDNYALMKTVFHETRHAYQHETVDNPGSHGVSEGTRTIWEDNFDDYQSTSKGDTFEEYVQQPVEWDARGFADQDLEDFTPVYEGSWGDGSE